MSVGLSVAGFHLRPTPSATFGAGAASGFALSGPSARWLDHGHTGPAVLWFAGTTSALLLVRELWAAL